MAEGKRQTALTEDSRELYEGIAAVYEKLADVLLCAGREYREKASGDARISKIADMLVNLGTQKPNTFYEARGAEYLFWMIRSYSGSDIGRMDYHLKEFFEREISNGTLTENEALSYLIDVWNGMDRRGSGDTLTSKAAPKSMKPNDN